MNITEFRAKCLALLDDVDRTGGTITVTKRGQAVATVEPVRRAAWKSPDGAWAGKVTLSDDVLESDTSELWEVVHNPEGCS